MSRCRTDASIGPWVGPDCRGGLDFTLLFELICLQYVPCTIFIAGVFWQQTAQPSLSSQRIVRSGTLRLAKLCSFIVLVAAYVACIVINGVQKPMSWRVAIGAAALEAFASALSLRIVDQYHLRSSRSSAWVSTWLSLTILLDIANVRTQWLVKGNIALAIANTLAISFKLLCLGLESVSKHSLLADAPLYSPEELAAPLGRLTFSWTYSLLRRGLFGILSMNDLMTISADLKSDKSFGLHPFERKSFSIFQDLVRDMPIAFLAPIPARIFLMGFSLAQPFVVHATLNYSLFSNDQTKGSLLIAAYIFVFVGYALSNATYWHLGDRFRMRTRIRLIELIYDCTYKSSRNFDNRDTPSLITTDIETFMIGFETFHEIWASMLQIAIAVGILSVYIGWACVGPIAACFGCLLLAIPLVIFLGPALFRWNSVIAHRISVTTSILRQLRDVRLLGLGGTAFNFIQQLRRKEIATALLFRQLLFFVIILSLCPLVTFALYAFKVSEGNGAAYQFVLRAFTALNLLGLIFTPFTLLLQSMPLFGAALAALLRVQHFVDAAKEAAHIESTTAPRSSDNILEVENASFCWSSDAEIIRDISLQLPHGHFLAVTGPVASGKSTLLEGILRLTKESGGSVLCNMSTISYCPQKPWIMSGTVQENIVCGLSFDQEWFDSTVAMCALTADLKHWEQGHCHEVGNDGANLSGGQRQRVALARAVYSRTLLVLLDDPLSGLDHGSSQHIQRELLGPEGWFRRHGASVVLVTHIAELIAIANQVLSLAKDGTVAYQGSPAEYLQQGSEKTRTSARLHDVDDRMEHQMDVSLPADNAGHIALAFAQEDANRKSGDWMVYWYYARNSGVTSTLMFLFGAALTAAAWQVGILWIKRWSDDALFGHLHGVSFYIGIYGLITAIAGVGLAATAAGSMIFMVSRGSSNFHAALLQSVSRASVSYFGARDIAVTLNRFVLDLKLIDWELPLALTFTISYLFICITQAVVIAFASQYMGIAVAIAVVVLVAIQRLYLRTSRQLRLLEIEAKAPLYTTFHETVEGIPSIRAYGDGLGQLLKEKQRQAANTSQQPMFLLLVVQRLLLLIIDLVVAVLATVLIALVVSYPSIGRVASLGVGLVNLTLFNQFLTLVIRYWTEFENTLGAISRIKSFTAETPVASGGHPSTGQQQDRSGIQLDEIQPATSADIVIQELTTYFERDTGSSGEHATRVAALDNVSLNITAGTKIAIVGRSGSGKSTLLSCLTRIMQPSSGKIRIGGIDIATIDQETVQTNFICVTQTFFFLPQVSLKENLDLDSMTVSNQKTKLWTKDHRTSNFAKSDDSNDEGIVGVLKDLDLWRTVEDRGGLLTTFDPGVWSTGQLQLLNLARAVLKARRRLSTQGGHRDWKIVLLDEATSSVDRQTAALMRRIIKKDFEGYTIISVEHRLEDVKEEMDQVVRLDKGRVVEHGAVQDVLNLEF